MSKLWSFVKRRFNILYILAIGFIALGAFLFIRPVPKGMEWQQSIGAVILGGGFTFLISTISAGRSILEENRKAANLSRKREVYGPLHAELKQLREIFANAQIGHEPYPQWMKMPEMNFNPYITPSIYPKEFSNWSTFKKDYHIYDFTPTARKLLDHVENALIAYNEANNNAKKEANDILRQHLADKIKLEEQRPNYQEWQQKRMAQSANPPRQPWFEYIERIKSSSTFEALDETVAVSWTSTLVWILANRPDQAAREVYENDIKNAGATDFIPLSWFQDIFNEVSMELKNMSGFQAAIAKGQEAFQQLQKSEDVLQKGLDYIQDRYEGGTPPV